METDEKALYLPAWYLIRPHWVFKICLRLLSPWLWCHSHKHHHFCIAKIGRAVLPVVLIPLVEMLYLVIGTTLQDRILIAEKLTELLILTLWSNWPWEHSTRYSRYTASEVALKSILPPQNS